MQKIRNKLRLHNLRQLGVGWWGVSLCAGRLCCWLVVWVGAVLGACQKMDIVRAEVSEWLVLVWSVRRGLEAEFRYGCRNCESANAWKIVSSKNKSVISWPWYIGALCLLFAVVFGWGCLYLYLPYRVAAGEDWINGAINGRVPNSGGCCSIQSDMESRKRATCLLKPCLYISSKRGNHKRVLFAWFWQITTNRPEAVTLSCLFDG